MYFDISHKYPKLKKKRVISYEHGAHFPYISVYNRLINLINELPADRLGRDGVYFQEDNDPSTPLIKSKSMENISKLTPKPISKDTRNNANSRLKYKLKTNSSLVDPMLLLQKDLFKRRKLMDNKEERTFLSNSISKIGQFSINVNGMNHLEKDMFLPSLNIGKNYNKIPVLNQSSKKLLCSQMNFPLKLGYNSIMSIHKSLGFSPSEKKFNIK